MAAARTFEIHQAFLHPDEPVQNYELFSRAWDECIELQVQDKERWAGRSLLSLQSIPRWEIGAVHGGEVVGAILIGHDPWDCHVGPCASVFAQYVLPEFRLQGISGMLMRRAVRIARSMDDVQVLAYTHRQGPWRYETIYKPLKGLQK